MCVYCNVSGKRGSVGQDFNFQLKVLNCIFSLSLCSTSSGRCIYKEKKIKLGEKKKVVFTVTRPTLFKTPRP